MAVNCRTCKHYHRMIETYNTKPEELEDTGCLLCADYPRRKSFYSPIIHKKADREKGDEQEAFPGIG